MTEYKRLTGKGEKINNVMELHEHRCECMQRLAELEDKIENGTLIEVDDSLIGESIIGIHKYVNGTYSLDLDENFIIGFRTDGIVTWNETHKFNDYFFNGLYFIDNDKGRAEAKAKIAQLKGEL